VSASAQAPAAALGREGSISGATGDHAVREARRAARVVAEGQVVHQRRERHLCVARVGAADRVHHHVAVGQQVAALAAGQVGDGLHTRSRILLALQHALEGAGEAVARGGVLEAPAGLEVEGAQGGGPLGVVAAEEHRVGERRQARRDGDEGDHRSKPHHGDSIPPEVERPAGAGRHGYVAAGWPVNLEIARLFV